MAQTPFWNDTILALSNRSWIPLHNLLQRKSNSWATFWACIEPQDICPVIDNQVTPSNNLNALKVLRVRLYPTPEQEIVLKRCFDASRWTYNRCIDLIKSKVAKRTKGDLRNKCINSIAFPEPEMQWLFETPYSIRDEAMNDLLKAYNVCFILAERRHIDHFTMGYRLKSDTSQSIIICHSRITENTGKTITFFPQTIKGPIACGEHIPPIRHDCRLQWLPQVNQFYLCIPIDIPSSTQDEALVGTYQRIIALDPGVRTFMTGYDPRGFCFKWGHSDINKIYRLCCYLDRLQSQWSQKGINHKKRYRLKRAGARLRLKIHNMIDDSHKKLAHFLCKNFDLILIPKFETSQMVLKGRRKIRSKTARAMLTWAHYRFRQRLIAKAREYYGCQVMIVDEAYTSKTCGRCGHLNNQLGGRRYSIALNVI